MSNGAFTPDANSASGASDFNVKSMQRRVMRVKNSCGNEASELLCDARSLRAYRDELDAFREKTVKIDSLFSFSKLVLVGPIDCAIDFRT